MSSSLHQLSRFTPASTNGQKVQTDLPGSKSNGAQSKLPISTTSLSGSETDVSTSTENLSQEERYVIRHTARQEPQGQEKQEGNDGLSPHAPRQHSLDNASSYNTLIIHTSGEDGLDPWASLSPSRLSSLRDSYISATSSHSKTTSFPSSSNSSSPTLSGTVTSAAGTQQSATQQLREINDIPDDYLSQSHVLKHLAKEVKVVSSDCLLKDSEDDSNPPRRLLLLDLSPETHSRLLGHRYSTPIHSHSSIARAAKLSLSRSQPDLSQIESRDKGTSHSRSKTTRGKEGLGRAELVWPASDMIQLLIKENSSLKSELEACFKKVAKSQKLEQEVTNIHHSHQELMQSSERREKLERAARQRLQEDNRVLRQQYELLLSQLESPHSSVSGNHTSSSDEVLMLRREISKRDAMLAQLMAQNKELTGCRERQEIELAAQRATLQEQRTHIDILDTALTNAQANVMRLEEECRKRQLYEERVVQLQQSLSSLQLAREQLEGEINDLRLSRRVNNAAAQTAPTSMSADLKNDCEIDKRGDSKELCELRQRLRERDERLLALESEVSRWQQWYLEENAMRQAVIDAASIPRDAKIAALEKTSQESERLMAEARSDKIRQLDELHAAQRRMADMESRSHELESRLAEKDAMIKVLQAAHHHHHSLLPSSGGSANSPMLSRGSPHHHLHHGSTSSSYHRQPSPSSLGGAISNASMLSSLASGTGSGLAGDLGASTVSTTGVSTSASLAGYPRSFANMRTPGTGLGYQRSSSVVADYGTSPSSVSSCSGSPLVTGPGTKTAAGSTSSRSFTEDNKSLDDQLQGLDSQLLSGRVLCCFSGFYNRGLTTRKEGISQPLLVGLKRRPPLQQQQQQITNSSSPTNQQEDLATQIKYKRIQNSHQVQSQSSSDEGTVKLPSTPPPNSSNKDSPSKETSVLYMSGRYNAKSASPSSKQFLSRYSPNQSASLPPTPPPMSKDSDMYYLRYGNKGSLPPTPPPSSKDTNPFFISSSRFNTSQEKSNDIFYRYVSSNSSNQSSLPPTPPPTDKDHVDRYLKSSSFYDTSSSNNGNKTNHEILLLEKQGRTSQKQRRSSAGSQASSEDMNRSCLPPSAIPRPKPNLTGTIPRKPSRSSSSSKQSGYNRLEESISKESLVSNSNNNNSNNVTSKLRLFQQSRKLTPSSSMSDSSKTSSREKLSAGMKYRIQL